MIVEGRREAAAAAESFESPPQATTSMRAQGNSAKAYFESFDLPWMAGGDPIPALGRAQTYPARGAG
jgi:hypothetical protein